MQCSLLYMAAERSLGSKRVAVLPLCAATQGMWTCQPHSRSNNKDFISHGFLCVSAGGKYKCKLSEQHVLGVSILVWQVLWRVPCLGRIYVLVVPK